MSRVEFSKDLKFTVRPRKFPDGHRPLHAQEECIVEATLPELNDLCKQCMFCGIADFSRRANELGIHGFMSNADGKGKTPTVKALEPTERKPSEGIDLRDPVTQILQMGRRYVCRNRKAGAVNIYELGPTTPGCEHFRAKVKPEKKKPE